MSASKDTPNPNPTPVTIESTVERLVGLIDDTYQLTKDISNEEADFSSTVGVETTLVAPDAEGHRQRQQIVKCWIVRGLGHEVETIATANQGLLIARRLLVAAFQIFKGVDTVSTSTEATADAGASLLRLAADADMQVNGHSDDVEALNETEDIEDILNNSSSSGGGSGEHAV